MANMTIDEQIEKIDCMLNLYSKNKDGLYGDARERMMTLLLKRQELEEQKNSSAK